MVQIPDQNKDIIRNLAFDCVKYRKNNNRMTYDIIMKDLKIDIV